jgi:hypothetical protein
VKRPKLRTAEKVVPPYPLNKLPLEFPYKFGREIIHHLAADIQPSVEGPEWERIFALSIGAKWKPSNVGLDDIVLGVCAWGAKSVKNEDPFSAKTVRLISGRNSPSYSFSQHDLGAKAEIIGKQVLGIWNGRVESLRNKFSHLRTVILVKSLNLSEFVIFETDTIMYPPDHYRWERNERNNLEGFDIETGKHRFTWQPHGSQFTIIEPVPARKLCVRIKKPPSMTQDAILNAIGFDKSWIQVVRPK